MSIKDRGMISVPMQGGGEIVPEGVSFDGSTDYLSRSSDLVGNVDSKTFTFSCWAYVDSSNTTVKAIYSQLSGSVLNYIYTYVSGGLKLGVQFKNTAGTTICKVNDVDFPYDTWTHILISVDLVNTANRHVYINDTETSGTWVNYVNDTIDFTVADSWVASNQGATFIKCRLSHVFLDYTYRDLSIEANRRLFITADGKPA